ncbi:Protein FAR1-RELATED SEQUENCE 3 [Linum grandiflorum]
MPRPKLILICQCGGDFVKEDNGSMSYSGGDAHAVDVNPDTTFDDLKLRVAQTCNLDLQSVCIKYFIPGVKKILITLANDKEFKTMYDFYGDSITADIYVTGTQGFVAVQATPNKRPASSRAAKPAGTVTRRAASKSAVASPSSSSDATSTSSDFSVSSADLSVPAATPQTPTGGGVIDSPLVYDLTSTPADTVKKRRRTASWKIGANGQMMIVSGNDNAEESIKSALRSKSSTNGDKGGASYDVSMRERCVDMISVDDRPRNATVDSLVASWRDGITGVGQEFESVVQFRDVLQKYSVAYRFGYKLKKNDANRVSAYCASRGCSWKILLTKLPNDESLRIRKMEDPHTCGEDSWRSVHPKKNWLVNTVKERLKDSPHHKPKQLAQVISEDFGIEVNYAQVRRAIQHARMEMLGSDADAYRQLPWFCDKLQEANPGSCIKLIVDDENKFQRLFVSYRAQVEGFENGCRPILYLDSTPLKSKHHEILLTASALDGDDDIFPVSCAIVDVENKDSWRWFLEQLRSAISSSEPITLVSEREKELRESALEVFENGYHRCSLYHLLEEFKRNLKGPFLGDGRPSLPVYMLGAACTPRVETFNMLMERIKAVSTKAYEWLVNIEAEHWANAYFKGEQYIPEKPDTFNTGEFYSKWIEEVWEMPITMKLEALRGKTMELIETRKTESDGWAANSLQRMTPSKEKKLQEEGMKARSYKVLFSNGIVFEVHDGVINVVDVESRRCTCTEWIPNEFPCRHAIAVCSRTGNQAYDYCSKYYSVENYRATYSGSINPVTDTYIPPVGEEEKEESEINNEEEAAAATETVTVIVLPPTTPKPPALPKESYYKRRGDLKRIILCTRCKGEGHNKATCKEPAPEGEVVEEENEAASDEQPRRRRRRRKESSSSSNGAEKITRMVCANCKGEGHSVGNCNEPLLEIVMGLAAATTDK